EAYGEALKLRAMSSEAFTNLGIVREQMGDLRGARAAYEKAIQTNPDALAPVWNTALLLEHSGQSEEAERWYKMDLGKVRKEEEQRSRGGYLPLPRAVYRGRAEALEDCLRYRGNWPDGQATLALATTGLGEPENAAPIYDKMIEADA